MASFKRLQPQLSELNHSNQTCVRTIMDHFARGKHSHNNNLLLYPSPSMKSTIDERYTTIHVHIILY